MTISSRLVARVQYLRPGQPAPSRGQTAGYRTSVYPHEDGTGRQWRPYHSPAPGTTLPMESFIIHWGYAAVFLFGFLEACCVPIPSEITFGFAGVL